ncbi:hypothetical protein MAR_019369 [Mya arenaria]|uniref:Uncharacterized protein n=1 Tax=Mya arenaria TaxID=6604 RepID=A0ABY7EKY8_MYAAR|nr:hypothetical protein MAR_019369 [Mya arenaria]
MPQFWYTVSIHSRWWHQKKMLWCVCTMGSLGTQLTTGYRESDGTLTGDIERMMGHFSLSKLTYHQLHWNSCRSSDAAARQIAAA